MVERKVKINKAYRFHYIAPTSCVRKFESPRVKQEFAAWVNTSKNNNELNVDEILAICTTFFK